MKSLLILSAVVFLGSVGAMAAEELAPGDPVGAFYVKDVTGPAAGTELCYRCRFGNQPVVTIFTREITDELATLIKEVDGLVGQNSDRELAAFVVLLTDDADAQEAMLKAVAEAHGIVNVPLTTFNDAAGPRGYKLTRDAEVTVMMWVDGELAVNDTFNSDDLSEDTIAGVVRNTGKILN
jgi:hypothetical protein